MLVKPSVVQSHYLRDCYNKLMDHTINEKTAEKAAKYLATNDPVLRPIIKRAGLCRIQHTLIIIGHSSTASLVSIERQGSCQY